MGKKRAPQFVAEGTDGTSNVKRHQETCTGRQDGAPPPIASLPTIPAAPPPGVSPESSNSSKAANWEEATADLARMIALHGYDPSFVEDSYFRSFVRQLNPDYQVPSQAAIEDICDLVCDEANRVLESELERTSAEVNVAIDIAETALGKVLYAACHFIDEDWNRRLMILDINTVVPKGMSYMPLFVTGSGPDPDSEDIRLMSERINDHEYPISERVFSKATGTIGHFDECLQLVARYETAYNHNNDALQMIASCLFNNVQSDYAMDLVDHAKDLAAYSKTRQEREELYSQLGLDHLPYDKDWISFYSLLQFLYKEEKENFSSLVYKSGELMRNVFGEIYRASKTISDPNRPTSNIVLRELFKVRETLQSSLADVSVNEAGLYEKDVLEDDLAEVLEKAKDILDRRIEEEYLQWSIPLVLDPRYKLKQMKVLFIRAFNSKANEYITNITKEIKKLCTSFSTNGGEETDEDPIHEKETTGAHQLELYRYLEDPLMKDTDDFDILSWWKLNSSEYPTLARMARAALAMPTCSKLSSEQMSQITSKIRGYSKGSIHEQDICDHVCDEAGADPEGDISMSWHGTILHITYT